MNEKCEKSVYTVNDVCRMFSVTRKTLYNWEAKGILKSFKIGGTKRYNKEMIDKLINTQEELK